MTIYFADFVIKLALILFLSVLPSLAYLLIFRQAKERWQTRLRRAQLSSGYSRDRPRRDIYQYGQDSSSEGDRRRPISKYFIGDTDCANNARSPYIRCAINPEGPCEDCVHFEKRY
ncbi:MAG: DUF6464 family protein [Cyanobacteria bacterium P01_G01_bin.19]